MAYDQQMNALARGVTPQPQSAPQQQQPNEAQQIEQMLVDMANDPANGTDEGMMRIDQLAQRLGVRPPWHRQIQGPPPADRGGPIGPSGRPMPLERPQRY
jgi:hypothetical protein